MKETTGQNILANIPRDQFVGRKQELESLLAFARSDDMSVVSLLKAPGCGATELLLQVFDELFREDGIVIPVYFALRPSDSDPGSLARRYQRELLTQIVAFRRRDPSIINSADVRDLADISDPEDREWIERAVDRTPSLISLLARPLGFARLDARVLVMIDDVENITRLNGAGELLADLTHVLARSGTPYLIAGARRFLFGKLTGRSMILGYPAFSDGVKIATAMSERYEVPLNEQTRDLIAVQMGGNLRNMSHLFTGASRRQDKFDSFRAVQSAYSEEVFGGRLSLALAAQIDEIVSDPAKVTVMELLRSSFNAPAGSLPLLTWRHACGFESPRFRQTMELLHIAELVNCGAGSVHVDRENYALADFVSGRRSLEEGKPRALVFGESLSQYIKRAPELLARFYRRNVGLGLKGLLRKFDGQEVPAELLDYRKFRDRIKGLNESHAASSIERSADRTKLPHIAFAANTSAFYPKLEDLIDGERSAIAIGFGENNFEKSVWIGAEIESKLEADAELAEFWCDRLEMAAAHCGFSKFTIWLVSPEGFSGEALDVLDSRNAAGSSRHQVELLRQAIFAVISDTDLDTVAEYEMIIPMGNDTEMIAARTLEDIARKYEFPSKMINQMKTALVEACINAAEHSLSPDRRIYQKFRITNERAEITVANRGLRLLDRVASEAQPANGRRGWGLKLIKSLMNEVRIEATDDGTCITMVKYLRGPQSN